MIMRAQHARALSASLAMALRLPKYSSPLASSSAFYGNSIKGSSLYKPVVATRNMATLQDLRMRLNSIKSIRKITSSMKMVAASKLRIAQGFLEKTARPFSAVINKSMENAYVDVPTDKRTLFLAVTSDRGLCGAVNSSIVKEIKLLARALPKENVDMIVVGDKGKAGLQRDWRDNISISAKEMAKRPPVQFIDITQVAEAVVEAKPYDTLYVVYNRFVNVVTSQLTTVKLGTKEWLLEKLDTSQYDMDEMKDEFLTNLYEFHLSTLLYGALTEQTASELGARTSSMDGATRNAGDMIARLTLNYNRRRQAAITTELVEIISGAESIKKED